MKRLLYIVTPYRAWYLEKFWFVSPILFETLRVFIAFDFVTTLILAYMGGGSAKFAASHFSAIADVINMKFHLVQNIRILTWWPKYHAKSCTLLFLLICPAIWKMVGSNQVRQPINQDNLSCQIIFLCS